MNRKLRGLLLFLIVAMALVALSGCLASNLPRAAFTVTPPSRSGYPPLDVTFDASASSSPNGVIVSYAWDFDDGETGSGKVVSHTFTEKGTYSVTLVVTDSSDKVGARTQTVEALNFVPVADFTPSAYTVGVDQPIRFDASDSYDTDGEIVEYLWSFGDGTSDEGVEVEHRYSTAQGSGWRPQVRLTVVDEDGGQGSVTRTIIVVGCDDCG